MSNTRPSTLHPQPVLLAGPTAVGKSEVALGLAERVGGEIISVDSMQVYRGLDIGTAKLSAEDRARVPHHLLDILPLTEAFDAGQFLQLAHRSVAEIQARGRVPILCGGTGLYFKAFLEGLREVPDADAGLRAELEAAPLPELLRELAERDPLAYERIDRQNPRRVIRAVEVLRLTGKPLSQLQAQWSAERPPPPGFGPANGMMGVGCSVGLTRASGDLERRIEARVEEMFRRGLVAETEQLLAGGLAQNRNAMQALGYRQVVEHLQGVRSLPATVELVKIRTRQYARRQMKWFRRQMRLSWVLIEPGEEAAATVEKVLKHTKLARPAIGG